MATASSKIDEAARALRLARIDIQAKMEREPPQSELYSFLRVQEDRIHEALAALGE